MPNIIEHGKAPNTIEVYECNYCGCKFEVSGKERMAARNMYTHHHWPCPDCGEMCFTMTEYANFKKSGGGKF